MIYKKRYTALQGVTGFVREYMINGIQIHHPSVDFAWLKFGADFMITISYSLFLLKI